MTIIEKKACILGFHFLKHFFFSIVSSDLEEVKLMVGMDPQSEENLHEAFMAVLTGDERPLLKMGMPQEEWFDVQFMLNRLIEGGLQV